METNHITDLRPYLDDCELRACAADAKAGAAFDRLLQHARGDSGQARRVADFIAATHNGRKFKFDLFDLRAVDVTISDDMLTCLDALRWGKRDLYKITPNGEAGVSDVLVTWGFAKSGR